MIVRRKFVLDVADHGTFRWAFGGVIITLLAVSYQSIKAALINPVKSLRSE